MHEEWPAITFDSPSHYINLSEEDKKNLALLKDDFCIISWPDQTDRFIRCTLSQTVVDHCDNLEYGLWVSLSEKSFRDYIDNFSNEHHEVTYFGWLCNDIPGYDMDGNIPANVLTRGGTARPEIIPHKEVDHPFIKDYYNGITKATAEKRIQDVLSVVSKRNKSKSKPWWKIW